MSAGSALIQRNSLLKIGELRAYSRTAMKEITHNPLVPQFRFMYFPNDIENGMSILAIMSDPFGLRKIKAFVKSDRSSGLPEEIIRS